MTRLRVLAGQTQVTTFTFKLQGEALTGTILKQNNPVAITNGVFKGDQVWFQTIHEASFPKGIMVTTTFSGTLDGNIITGKMARKTAAADYGVTPWQINRVAAGSK